MRAYILLDASGSMGSKWSATIESLNAYVRGLPKSTNIYIAAFDSGYSSEHRYDVVRNTTVKGFKDITVTEVKPSGGTPLFDSMAKLLDHAFTESPEQAYIVVVTDGEENTSRQYNKDVIKEKLARAEDRNWEVIFMGVEFANVEAQATSLGLGAAKVYNVSAINLNKEMAFMACNSTQYATKGTRTTLSAADKTRASASK